MESEPPLSEAIPRPPELILGELALVLAETERLQEQAQALVDEARQHGATWAQIADVAGVRRQSAYQRWSETGRAKHAEYQRKRLPPAD